jgi:hypothetical protein
LRDPLLHAIKGSPAIAEGRRRSDEVANSMGVGATLRSGTQARPDRHPVVPHSCGSTRLRAQWIGGEQAQEGRAKAQRLVPAYLGGGKGHESIGSNVSLTGPVSSTDSGSEQRSEVGGSTPVGSGFAGPFADPDAPYWCSKSSPVSGVRPLVRFSSHFGGEGVGQMLDAIDGETRAPVRCRQVKRRLCEIADVRGEGGARACPGETGANGNNMRAMGTERCYG